MVPDALGRLAFGEEEHHGLDACSLEGAGGAVEDRVEVTGLQEFLAQVHRAVVRVGQEGVLDDHRATSTGLQHANEVLQEEVGRLAGLNREVLLNLLALLPTKGGIGEHHGVAVLFLNVHDVLVEGVGVDDVGSVNAVQDHVHDADNVGQPLLLLAKVGPLL